MLLCTSSNCCSSKCSSKSFSKHSSYNSDCVVFRVAMGLLKIIRKVKRREREMRLLMLGLDNAGKTTVLYKFIDEDISDIPPTVGFNIRTISEFSPSKIQTDVTDEATKQSVAAQQAETGGAEEKEAVNQNQEAFRLNIYDVGGQRSIRSFWRNYLEQTDGLIWVVDSADVFRLAEDCKDELSKLLKEERLAGASLLIFANKQDLDGALSAKEIAETLELEKIQATGRHCAVFPCSAWSDKDSIAQGLSWLVSDIASRVYRSSYQ